MKRMVNIGEIKRRLHAKGIGYYMQGGQVIKTFSPCDGPVHEQPLHYSVKSVNEAAAGDAWRVIEAGEELAKRWQEEV